MHGNVFQDALLNFFQVVVSRVEHALRDLITTEPQNIAAAYLFASVARGTARASSDVDIAVLYSATPAATLEGLPLALETALEKRLGKPVQIVVLNTAPVDLVHRVLRDGRLLIDTDPLARIRFEIKARNEYFDLEPVRKLCRRQAAKTP